MKVLVVDDILYTRKLISRKLLNLGYDVIEAENGIEAVEGVKNIQPDIIIMDVMMPDMDGITATKIIREDFDGKIIVCSAMSDRNRIFEALEAGANDYIAKPIDDYQLRRAIENQ